MKSATAADRIVDEVIEVSTHAPVKSATNPASFSAPSW
ncbi:hypothetical protein PAMC26510_22230 [Caballeronia sordidicola]|uniref:Uncharacterized protein n=1 Tax=Caballeronia sordidicola TaxID=196367 RepID=A0A242MLF4_CABSO|nr:hypothetical protein PAMC26510_22230 [Caballeronia sordidicola]